MLEAETEAGIISSIAFCPDYSGTYAAGTFSGTVSIYSEDTGSTPLQHLEGVHQGGVTHLAFHPLSPTTLFVGSRRSSSIQVYDLRDVTAPLAEYDRKGSSNQRLWFEVDPWGRYLASGDEDGLVKVWDISDLSKTEPIMQRRLVDGEAFFSTPVHEQMPLALYSSTPTSRCYSRRLGRGDWKRVGSTIRTQMVILPTRQARKRVLFYRRASTGQTPSGVRQSGRLRISR